MSSLMLSLASEIRPSQLDVCASINPDVDLSNAFTRIGSHGFLPNEETMSIAHLALVGSDPSRTILFRKHFAKSPNPQ